MFLRWIELEEEINQKIDGETRLPSRSFQVGGVTEWLIVWFRVNLHYVGKKTSKRWKRETELLK